MRPYRKRGCPRPGAARWQRSQAEVRRRQLERHRLYDPVTSFHGCSGLATSGHSGDLVLRTVAVGLGQIHHRETGSRAGDVGGYGHASHDQLYRRCRRARTAIGQVPVTSPDTAATSRGATVSSPLYSSIRMSGNSAVAERNRDLIGSAAVARKILGVVNRLAQASARHHRERGRISVSLAVSDRSDRSCVVRPADDGNVQIAGGLQSRH